MINTINCPNNYLKKRSLNRNLHTEIQDGRHAAGITLISTLVNCLMKHLKHKQQHNHVRSQFPTKLIVRVFLH